MENNIEGNVWKKSKDILQCVCGGEFSERMQGTGNGPGGLHKVMRQ